MGNPLRPLCHRELLEGGGGVLGVRDGRVVAVGEVDGGLGGGRPGLWRPVPSALAPSGRGTGARGPFAWWWTLGWARWGDALAPLRGEFPSVFGASAALVFVSAELDRVGAVELQVVAFWLVRGAAALVEVLPAVPDHSDLWPPVVPQVAEAVLDRALAPDPVARMVIAEGLLDLRAFFEPWVRLGWGRCWWREGGC